MGFGVSQTQWCISFRGSNNKGHTILGSMLGAPYLGKLSYTNQGVLQVYRGILKAILPIRKPSYQKAPTKGSNSKNLPYKSSGAPCTELQKALVYHAIFVFATRLAILYCTVLYGSQALNPKSCIKSQKP